MISIDRKILELVNSDEMWFISHLAKHVKNNQFLYFPSISTMSKNTGFGLNKTRKIKKQIKERGVLKYVLIKNNENEIVELNLLTEKELSPENIRTIIESNTGKKMCEWCKGKCHLLEEHHYPVPRKLGGKEIVKICGKCHSDFHHLEKQ